MPLALTRELRFGLHQHPAPAPPHSANGFAANPALADFAPFLTLRATIFGEPDAATGMLINIKHVDRLLRDHAVPFLHHAFYTAHLPAPRAMLALWELVTPRFAPHRLTMLELGLSPYLSYALHSKEPSMIRLSQRFEFSAAHRLHSEALSAQENLDVFGRCNNPNGHGHNYELEVTLTGPLSPAGQLMPIHDLQRLVNQHIIDPFDHKHLNLDCPEFRQLSPGKGLNPTVENIAQVLYRRLAPHIPQPLKLASLRLWETPKTMAEYAE